MYGKAVLTAGTFDRMLAFSHGKAGDGLAVRAFAVAADLAVTDAVALQDKEAFDAAPYREPFAVFLPPFINVFGKIAKQRPDKDGIRQKEQRYKKEPCEHAQQEKKHKQCIIELIRTVAAVHKAIKRIQQFAKHNRPFFLLLS